MIGVFDPHRLLGSAVAELPLDASRAEGPERGVAVVSGAGDWQSAARAALRDGALSVLVVEPGGSMPGEFDDLREVVLLRPRLAAELLGEAVSFAAVVAECTATAAGLDTALRDTIGWVRAIAGEVRVTSRDDAAGGTMALLETTDGTPVTITARALSGVPDGATIRVSALGTDRREVIVDDAAGILRIGSATEGLDTVATGQFQSRRRVALSRAVAAAANGEPTGDLARLDHDTRIARAILHPPK